MISQKIIRISMHIASRTGNAGFRIGPSGISRSSPVLGTAFIRCVSTNDKSPIETSESIGTSAQSLVQNIPSGQVPASLLDKIPDAPLPPPPGALDVASAVGEPTLQSLGLGGWSPIGIVQQLLELLHVGAGIPWWGTITIGTICVRTLLFPLVIKTQKNAANLHNSMPGIVKIQEKLTEARSCGDHLEGARQAQALSEYMTKNNCNPMKNMLVPLIQAPIFISFFFGLKRMTNLPVESMREGGLYWFKDLTVCDPYYLLPLITTATLALTIRLGIDGPKLEALGMFKYVIQAIPIVVLPFTINFPAAIVWYWVSTNIISLIQVSFLRIPQVRKFFNIPLQVNHPPNAMPSKKKFKEGFKDAWTNMKLAREMTDRQQIDRVQFNKAGRGPIEKTYTYNPIQEHLKKQRFVAKKS